jgi:hypothetical protein
VEGDKARWSRNLKARGGSARPFVSSTSSPGNHGVVRAVAWRRAAPTVPVRGGDGGRSGERARHHVPVAGGESTYS